MLTALRTIIASLLNTIYYRLQMFNTFEEVQ